VLREVRRFRGVIWVAGGVVAAGFQAKAWGGGSRVSRGRLVCGLGDEEEGSGNEGG